MISRKKKDIKKKKNVDDDDTVTVVTVRCIDMAAVTDVDRLPCAECGEMTWISKSFRGKKIDKIVCQPCYEKKYKNDKDFCACVTQECIDEALNWAKRSGYDITEEKMIRDMEDKIGKNLKIDKLEEIK